MRILHVVAGLPRAGGGLSEVVPRLACEAVRLGHQATIATVTYGGDLGSAAALEAEAAGVKITRFSPTPPGVIFFSWEMLAQLHHLIHTADVVHVHANWTFPVWWACRCALREGKPLVMSPHGCLDPVRLAHSAWKKRVAGVLDRHCLRRATAIHATSETERGWIASYLGKARVHGSEPRVVVIPNGVELPIAARPSAQSADRVRQVLYLGRLHPVKGLELLISAWAIASRGLPPQQPWRLTIAGPDEQGTLAGLEQQTHALGLTNVVFSGPLYGMEKSQALANSDLLVLPTRSENFGLIVAEALAAGIPVITTKAAPWSEIEGNCGWWVDVNVDAIAKALVVAMLLSDDDRATLGACGRDLVVAKYQWANVGRSMVELYQELVR